MSKNNQTPIFYVLKEDKTWAKARIAELEKAIQDLGPEFNIALNQSNETWHDNAPFDALRDTQAVMVAEMQNLKEILFKANISVPKPKPGRVGIGSYVTVFDGRKKYRYLLAGDWSPRIGQVANGFTVVSRQSPIGEALFDKKVATTINIGPKAKALSISVIG